jgi:MinD superfamily P-loop ATPase
MIISVASGKGGTGKTTVSTNLALSLKDGVTLLDCDVEEPNAHIFLRPDLTESQEVTTFIPEIVAENCTGCKKCVEICRFNALTVIGGKVLTFPDLCHGCGGCLEVCPEDAVREGSRLLGAVESGRVNGITFHHGRLRIGEPMAPPLITKVREQAQGDQTVIVDAPPGTSCPVIAAMRGTDFVLMVTEPTPFGLHDLRLGIEAVRVLGIPCGLVINRADLGDRKVYDYAAQEDIPILMEIPFDREIAAAYAKGIPIVAAKPEYTEKFRALFKKIETLVEEKRSRQ